MNPVEHCCDCGKSEDDREILCALVDAAAAHFAEGSKATDEERADAHKFLRAWWSRKSPPLEMPRL